MKTEKGFLGCSHHLPPSPKTAGPGTVPSVLRSSSFECDSLLRVPAGPSGAAQAGAPGTPAGPESACYCLSSPSGALCLDGVHPMPHALCFWESFLSQVPTDAATTIRPPHFSTVSVPPPPNLLSRWPLPCGLGHASLTPCPSRSTRGYAQDLGPQSLGLLPPAGCQVFPNLLQKSISPHHPAMVI